jgi:tripeptide aminopeptidase
LVPTNQPNGTLVPAVTLVNALTDSDRRRLHDTFEELCRIASPTGDERRMADRIKHDLTALGLQVGEDGAGAVVGSNAGNLYARIPGRTERSLMFCAHMDTVPLTAPIDPVRRDDGWENSGDGILGADNKAAVAAMVELARLLTSRDQALEIGLELVFTVAEETGLNGAREFDVGRLSSSFGYVFDHASPIGEIITASPTQMRIEAEIRGRAAHAGLQPEHGVNAIVAAAHAITNMPQGRLDPETTANVGIVAGGTETNVVPDRCTISAEVRAVEQEQFDRYVTQAIDALQDAADSAGCDLDLKLRQLFTGYRSGTREAPVALGAKALRRLGYEPTYRSSGGGSDANAFRLSGFPCTNLANGTERAHERTERVSFVALEGNLELMLALIDESSARGSA